MNEERTNKLLEDIRDTLNRMQQDQVEARKDLEYVKKQTTKTNGRVSVNENNIRELQDDRLRLRTYIAAMGAAITVGVYIIEKFLI